MSEIEIVKQIAQQALVTTALTGEKDNWLWDRAQRVLRNVEHICRLPELIQKNLPVDKFCLTASACFTEAGFIRFSDKENTSSRFTLAEVTADDLKKLSTRIVTEKLGGTLSASRIDKINKIIIESGNRFTTMTEAMILSDAENLDDMGAVGIFNEFRKYTLHGKSVADILQTWKRKLDYQYFQARLKEGFRFDPVKKLAQRRYKAVESFMTQLHMESTAEDLEEIIAGALEKV
jgi:hypothetical protein